MNADASKHCFLFKVMLVKTNAMPTNHRETLAGNAHNDVILFYLGNFTSMCVCVCVCVCVCFANINPNCAILHISVML